MKSFSRIYSSSAREQIPAWTPSELDIEFVVSPAEVQAEQILAILRKEEEPRAQRTHMAVAAWEPKEIAYQPPVKEIKAWDFVELSKGSDESPVEETWQEEPDFEKEAESVLTKARTQAEEILLEARAAADKIILQAQDEIDSEKKEGYQQGGREARAEFGEALRAAHAVVEEVRQWRDSLTTQGEQILVEMMKLIAQSMFGEGVRLDADALQVNLNRVMEHAQKLGDLNIFLNSKDAALLDPSWSEYQLLITGNRVKIIPSEKITPGGCIVKGNMGMVDGRVETQLAAVLNTIEEIRGAKE